MEFMQMLYFIFGSDAVHSENLFPHQLFIYGLESFHYFYNNNNMLESQHV